MPPDDVFNVLVALVALGQVYAGSEYVASEDTHCAWSTVYAGKKKTKKSKEDD